MIEVMNLSGTTSYGCFPNMKAAKPHLDSLRKAGELPDKNHEVIASQFKSGKLQQVYRIFHDGKWRTAAYTKPENTIKANPGENQNSGANQTSRKNGLKPPCRMNRVEMISMLPAKGIRRCVNRECEGCCIRFLCGFQQPVIWGSTVQPW